MLRINAARPEEQELFHAMPVSRVEDVGFDHQILVDEVGAVGVVGVDAADPGGGGKDIFRLFFFEERANRPLLG